MKILITGGCKNGKSSLAQRIVMAQGERRIYVATMVPRDAEDEDCIRRHREDRAGLGFETCEITGTLTSLAGMYPKDASLMIDSVTALLAEKMFQQGGYDPLAPQRAAADLSALCAVYDNIVFVSDGIYSDARRFDGMTEAYRAGLAMLEAELCGLCDAAVEMCFGLPVPVKGSLASLRLCKKQTEEKNGMILIIGGAHQGKRAFAREKLGIADEKILANAELLILDMIKKGEDPVLQMDKLARSCSDGAILLEDMCCGVVPMDPLERAWRIAVGRCGTALAARADSVYRVFCGRGTEICDA